MKEQLKRADLFGLAIVAAALITYSIRSVWSAYQTAAVVIGGVLILVSLVLKAGDIRSGLGRRSAKFGINSAMSVLFFVGILAFVNYLGAEYQKRVDMTSERIHSLSDQSAQVAGQLQQDLQIKAFYAGGEYVPDRDLLQLYKAQSNRISFEFVDPDKQPQVAQQYQVTVYGDFSNPMNGQTFRYGTLILEMGGKTERIEKQSEPLREEDVTNALMKIVKGETKTIYFTEGHGEKQTTSEDQRKGYQVAGKELERSSYVVKSLNLVREGKVPADASVVVMVGPSSEPFPNEIEMLETYLNGGGSVLLMLDPPPAPGFNEFLKKWSIQVGDNFVVDASGMGRLFGAGPEIPLITNYGSHKITEKFTNVMTFFPLVRSVTPVDPPVAGITTERLLTTNERSWGETDMKKTEVSEDESVDLKGPVSIAVVATKDAGENKKSRLVVVGDSDFAANGFFGSQRNGNLFVNMVTWLAQDENFISIQPKNPADRPLTMTDAQGKMVSYIAVLLLPGSILATGISVWLKRRK